MWSWFLHLTGASNESGPWYGFWSGFGGSWLPAYVGLVILYTWHHNCHVHGCWRLGRRKAGDFVVCHRHHPVGKVTADHVAEEHARWAVRRPVKPS